MYYCTVYSMLIPESSNMKLRIRDNTIRLRLSQTEVGALRADGRVAAATAFPGGARLEYAVESDSEVAELTATMRDGLITVRLPAAMAGEWADSEQVSLRGDQDVGDGEVLGLLVEKDFACLAPREGEDESDMYPHPNAGGC